MTSELSARQLKAIPILVRSKSIQAGCKSAGITRTAYYNWIKDPLFKEAINLERQILFDDMMEEVKRLSPKILKRFNKLLDSKNEYIVLRTIVEFFTIHFKQKEFEIGDRLDDLEKLIREKQAYFQ